MAVCEPAAVNVKPFHEYGSRLSHIVIAVVLVTSGFTVKFNVASESQPADEVSVAVCEPAAENVKPFHEYGSRLSHIVIDVVLVTSGFTVKFNVASESQPADDVSVAVCEPAAENVKPFHEYGSRLSHIVIAVVLVTSGFTVKFKVASESQPADDVSVAVCEPAAENVKPFHEYGSRLSHIVIDVVLVTSGFTVKFNVASESQPADDVSVAVCEPAAVNVKPFHEYGSRLSHIVIAVVLVTSGFTVKFKVASESQPADDVSVAVCEPAAENVKPFHEYGSRLSHIVIAVVLVTSGFTVKFKVASESQPADDVSVAVCEPAAVNVKPFHEYGSKSSQMVIAVVLVTSGFTVKFKVASESQPADDVSVAVCEPAAVNVKPFHEYGSKSSQIVIDSELGAALFIVKSKVTKLSHPCEVVYRYVAVLLLAVYVTPSIQVYESQELCTSVLEYA